MRRISHVPRTLKLLRDVYDLVAVVESFRGGRRRDLFGIADIFAAGRGEFVLVQVCSASHLSAHKKKCEASETFGAWLAIGGRFVMCSWRKAGGRWTPTWIEARGRMRWERVELPVPC